MSETIELAELDTFLFKMFEQQDRSNQIQEILEKDPLSIMIRVSKLGEYEKMQLGTAIDLAQMVINAVPQRNKRVAKLILRDALTLIDYQKDSTDTIKQEADKITYGYDAILQQTYEKREI